MLTLQECIQKHHMYITTYNMHAWKLVAENFVYSKGYEKLWKLFRTHILNRRLFIFAIYILLILSHIF